MSTRIPHSALRTMNLFLIGYRGTGKSTVARLLAERLGWPCVDADEEIELRAARSVAEIFRDGGEEDFRALEELVVRDLAGRDLHIISLGGGAVLRQSNREEICRAGTVVWLTAAPETIYQRIGADAATAQRRPKLTVGGLEEVRQLLDVRQPLYRACADHVIDTEDLSPAEIAQQIMDVVAQ